VNDEPTLSLVTPDHAIGFWRALGVLVWRGGVDARVALAFRRASVAHARQHAGGSAIVHLVETTSSVPDADTRKALAEIPEDARKATRFSAVVAEGDGLRGSLVRGVATGVSLLMRGSLPIKVFARVSEASRFAEGDFERGGVRLGSALEIETAIEAIRARIPRA
jgi:hypothetical protein